MTLAELINSVFLLGGNNETRIALEHQLRAVATAWKSGSAFLHRRELVVSRGAGYVLMTTFQWRSGPPMLARSPLVLTHQQSPKSEIILSARTGKVEFSGPNPGRTKAVWDDAKGLCEAWMIDGVTRAKRLAESLVREIAENSLPGWARGNFADYLFTPGRTARDIERIVSARPAVALAFVQKFVPDAFPS